MRRPRRSWSVASVGFVIGSTGSCAFVSSWPVLRRAFASSWPPLSRPGLTPEATRTVNGSPAMRAPTLTRTSPSPAAASSRPSSSSRNPSRRSPSFARTHSSPCVRRSSTSTRPPGAVMRAASATARAGILRMVQRLREQRDLDPPVARWAAARARPASTRRSTRGGGAPAPGRDRGRRPIDRRRPRATPSGPPRASGSPRHTRGRRPRRRQQHAEGTGPGRPAASRHELTRVACVGAAVRVEVLLPQPQHLLQPRLVGAHGRVDRPLLELVLERRPERPPAIAVLRERGRQAVVGEPGLLVLGDQAGIPAAGRDGATRPTGRARGCR